MALKPVPKAILIIAIVSAAGYAFTKFMPKSAPAPEVAAPAPTVVVPPTQAQVDTASEQAAAPAPAPTPAPETPRSNVTSGDAGLSAVLGAGR